MKTLDLNAYGVQEMNKQEMKTVEGGLGILTFMGICALVGMIFCFAANQ